VYILSIGDGKRIVFLSMESSFSNSVSRKAFPPIVMLPLKSIFARIVKLCKEITSFDEPVSVSEFYNPCENGFKRQHNNWREGFPRN
jgi:hypothetical protein